MMRRPFKPASGVSNIELFYDLIFVYCISVLTSLCLNVRDGFLDISTGGIYLFSFLAILQIWFYTTLLMNRYSDRSLSECLGLFVNMFLMYFMASGVHVNWHETELTFNLCWAAILANLAIQWLIKRHVYSNIDETDKRIMSWSAGCLLVQAAIAVVAAFLPERPSELASCAALLFGMAMWTHSRPYRLRPARFDHVAERCSLLTIIAFGEMVVRISSYMTRTSSIWYPIGVFVLAVGLFLIYIFEHDLMLDHHAKSDGMTYMTISSWLIVVIGSLTVAVEYMPMGEVDALPKSIFLSSCLVLYLLTSFLLGMFNRAEYRYSWRYVVGRITACAFIVVVGVVTAFDPAVCLGCHVLAVYSAFAYEWALWRRRSTRIELCGSLYLGDVDDGVNEVDGADGVRSENLGQRNC